MAREKIPVEIQGRTYELEADTVDPIHLQAIAKYVEEKLYDVSSHSSNQSTSGIAILAALNIADELFRLKSRYENLTFAVNNKTEELISSIDSVSKQ